VALSKAAFLASAAAVNRHLEATRADTWAHALPVFHVGGLGILARARLSGAAVIGAVGARWDARRFEQRVHETRATLTALVPSQVHDLVAAGLHAPSSLRAVVVGGARLDPELCADARSLGWPCLPSYGLTETCSQVATAPLDRRLAGSCDPVLPVLAHAAIRADEDMRLRIRADSLLTCCAEATDEGVRSWDPKEDGWLPTDDLGRVTSEGVEVLGRSSDSVKVLGEIVWIHRVEAAVRRWAAGDPAVGGRAEAAVVALPHARLGHELVVALASVDRARLEPLTEGQVLPSLAAFCRQALLPYEQPHRIAWVDAMPRTPLGKIQRQLLARQVSLETGSQG
jgi:O-succinylbenzoic acid--CoA ligase